MAWIKVHDEVSDGTPGKGDWYLCLQRCTYDYDDGGTQTGYRFIWRRPNGNLQAAGWLR